jgi:hypothetical protein
MKKFFIVCGLVIAFLLMVQSETLAQVINACVNNRNGALRIVSDPVDCSSKERAITLNQAGTPGPQGQSGTACWDLNANGVCDPEENKDGIGSCDALDCQGAPGPAGPSKSVLCYDNNGNELGIVIGYTGGVVGLFLDGINKFIELDPLSGGVRGSSSGLDPLWESYDCTGPCYHLGALDFIRKKDNSKFPYPYFVMTGPLVTITGHSTIEDFTGNCIQYPEGLQRSMYLMEEVLEEQIPFSLPVAVPFHFEAK